MHAAAVRLIQTRLRDLGHYTAEIDGQRGTETNKALHAALTLRSSDLPSGWQGSTFWWTSIWGRPPGPSGGHGRGRTHRARGKRRQPPGGAGTTRGLRVSAGGRERGRGDAMAVEVMHRWMGSEHHRENILDAGPSATSAPRYVGLTVLSRYGTYWVQVFGTLLDSAGTPHRWGQRAADADQRPRHRYFQRFRPRRESAAARGAPPARR